ncbi:MAG: ribosome-associated translation inhibitor RaiA [Rikenellaceae bacterium]|jgi:putative sigma-54 modulation protein|nr:ribosome-associated translation inhibitor RaiA [Rikenellaceae bacterium]
MNVKIQSVKFDADQRLIEFIENKFSKLERFAENVLSAEVILKVDKDHERGNKLVTLKVDLPGSELVAEHRSTSFEESVDEGIAAIKKQVEKKKNKN